MSTFQSSGANQYTDPFATGAMAGGVVTDHSRCVRCGYSLRGVPLDGACPRCNASVSASLTSRRLYLAEPAWLATLATNLSWNWMLLIGLIAYNAIVFITIGILAPSDGAVWIVPVLFSIPSTLISLARLWNWWAITTPEPSPSQYAPANGFSAPNFTADGQSLRVWIRGLLIATAVCMFLNTFCDVLLLATGFTERIDAFNKAWAATRYTKVPNLFEGVGSAGLAIFTLSWINLVLASLLMLAGFLCESVYLRRLAVRAGDEGTATFATITMIAAPLCFLLLGCVFGLGVIIACILWTILLARSEHMIRRCIAWQTQAI